MFSTNLEQESFTNLEQEPENNEEYQGFIFTPKPNLESKNVVSKLAKIMFFATGTGLVGAATYGANKKINDDANNPLRVNNPLFLDPKIFYSQLINIDINREKRDIIPNDPIYSRGLVKKKGVIHEIQPKKDSGSGLSDRTSKIKEYLYDKYKPNKDKIDYILNATKNDKFLANIPDQEMARIILKHVSRKSVDGKVDKEDKPYQIIQSLSSGSNNILHYIGIGVTVVLTIGMIIAIPEGSPAVVAAAIAESQASRVALVEVFETIESLAAEEITLARAEKYTSMLSTLMSTLTKEYEIFKALQIEFEGYTNLAKAETGFGSIGGFFKRRAINNIITKAELGPELTWRSSYAEIKDAIFKCKEFINKGIAQYWEHYLHAYDVKDLLLNSIQRVVKREEGGGVLPHKQRKYYPPNNLKFNN